MRTTPSATDAVDSPEERRPVTARVTDRVAAARGVDVRELTPLYEAVETDALDALTARADADCEIVFEYEGYVVTVNGPDDVRLSRIS